MENANALMECNILAGAVVLQHLMCVQQEKQQQQQIHVTVQAGEHLLEQVELELVNVQTTITQLTLHLVVVLLPHKTAQLHM